MAWVDDKLVMLTLLRSETPIASAVGTDTYGDVQVYGPPGLPTTWTIRKTITFLEDRDPADQDLPRQTSTFQFRIYAPTIGEANELFLVLFETLHRRRATTVTLPSGAKALFQYARLISASDEQEPELPWPYVQASFSVHILTMYLP